MNLDDKSRRAQEDLDTHVREIVEWHFSPGTGCPFWLDWAIKAGWDPRTQVKSFADLVARFPHFQDEWLRDLQPEVWVPKKFAGRPYNIFETGGTTGMPKQRIGWDDYKTDYEEFSGKVSDEHFPRGGAWLMVGPMGPQHVRFLMEEVLENRIGFYPTYGNTLMGLAASVPLTPEDKFSITYYAPQPRAVLRVVNPKQTEQVVGYGEWGRVELTTLTK